MSTENPAAAQKSEPLTPADKTDAPHRARRDSVTLLETSDFVCVRPDTPLAQAIEQMKKDEGGCVIVCDEGGAVVGIFTERDYLSRIAVEGRTSRETRVREVMSAPVVYVTPETTVEEAMAIMSDRRIRHLPVVDDGASAGIVAIGDLVEHQSRQQTFQIQHLTDYITAR